jgi:hypothetical protein
MARAAGVGKLIAGDIVGGIVTAPVFWYTRGLTDAARTCVRMVRSRWATLGVGVWVRNLFVPMFGQQDLTGKLISFFMRVIQIIWRTIAMALWVVIVATLFLLYLLGPVYVIIQFFSQLFGLFTS